jgi:hypothetical protein
MLLEENNALHLNYDKFVVKSVVCHGSSCVSLWNSRLSIFVNI